MEVGNITEIYSSPLTIEWEISDYPFLPKSLDYVIRSPIFAFKEHQCRLMVLPNGSERFPNVCTIRLEGIGKAGTVYWELQLHHTDSTLFRKTGGMKKDGQVHVQRMNLSVLKTELESECYSRITNNLKITCILSSETVTHREVAYKGTFTQTETTSSKYII